MFKSNGDYKIEYENIENCPNVLTLHAFFFGKSLRMRQNKTLRDNIRLHIFGRDLQGNREREPCQDCIKRLREINENLLNTPEQVSEFKHGYEVAQMLQGFTFLKLSPTMQSLVKEKGLYPEVASLAPRVWKEIEAIPEPLRDRVLDNLSLIMHPTNLFTNFRLLYQWVTPLKRDADADQSIDNLRGIGKPESTSIKLVLGALYHAVGGIEWSKKCFEDVYDLAPYSPYGYRALWLWHLFPPATPVPQANVYYDQLDAVFPLSPAERLLPSIIQMQYIETAERRREPPIQLKLPTSLPYRIGQDINIDVEVSEDGYLILLSKNAIGEVELIYPNRGALERARDTGKRFTNFLGKGWKRFSLSGESLFLPGKSLIKAIFTNQPIGNFESIFEMVPVEVRARGGPRQRASVQPDLGEEKAVQTRGGPHHEEFEWWEASCEFEVIGE